MPSKPSRPLLQKGSLESLANDRFEFGESLLWLAQYSAAKANGEPLDGLPLTDPDNVLSLAARTRARAVAIVDEAHSGPGVPQPTELEYLIQGLVVLSLDMLEQSKFLTSLVKDMKPGRPKRIAPTWFEHVLGPSVRRSGKSRGRPRMVEFSDAELLTRFLEYASDGRTLKDIAMQIAGEQLRQKNKHLAGRRLEENAERLLSRRRTALRKQREKAAGNSVK